MPVARCTHSRDPQAESAAARDVGLIVTQLLTTRCRMEFFDVGAVAWILPKCFWSVPDFTVEKYYGRLEDLDRHLRSGEPFIAHSTRHLIEPQRPRTRQRYSKQR